MTFAEAAAQAATPEYMEHNGGKLCVRRKDWLSALDFVTPIDGVWKLRAEGHSWDHCYQGCDWQPYKIHKPKPLSETLKCGDVVRLKDNPRQIRLVTGRDYDGQICLAQHRCRPQDIDRDWELAQ